MTTHGWLLGGVLALGLTAGKSEAQSGAKSFADLRGELNSGDIVLVVDQKGETVWGQVDAVSASSLTMFVGERQGSGASFPKTSRLTLLESVVVEIHRSDAEAGKRGRVFYRPVAGSFADLPRVVQAGDLVTITEVDGRVTRGKVATASATELTLRPSVATAAAPPASPTFQADRVLKVTRGGDSRWGGALIGLAIGLALPIASVATATGDGSDGVALIPLLGAGGFGIGWLIDGMINRRVEVFSAAPSPRARAEVSPILRRDVKGVALSLRF